MNNKNALADQHVMAVSKEFRPQAGELLERDLVTAFALIKAYEKDNVQLLCFFKCVHSRV